MTATAPADAAVRTLAVLMTCHNRRDRTLEALASLAAQRELPDGVALAVHLVDAGSSDGTADAVRSAYPATDVIRARPDVFWGTGTRIAAAKAGPHAHVLWLNDDVRLEPGALRRLLETAAPLDRAAVVVGAMRSGADGRTTYGGYRLTRGRTGRPAMVPLEPHPERALPCDTGNGNAVLVTAAARRLLGDIDRAFPHRMGDIDYGLRARRAGVPVLLAPGHAGVCDSHPPGARGSSTEHGIGRWTALRRRASPKEQPPGPWWRYCRRHTGPWAPLFFCAPYATALLRPQGGRAPG